MLLAIGILKLITSVFILTQIIGIRKTLKKKTIKRKRK